MHHFIAHPPLRSYSWLVWALAALTLHCLGGCSTYRTLDARSGEEGFERVDKTGKHYGQPYFLPKGLIRLVVQPEGGGGGGGGGGEGGGGGGAATTGAGVVITNTVNNTPTKGDGTPDQPSEDLGLTPTKYRITVERKLVPDRSMGPFYARYEQNWFYSEAVNLGVTDDGLLKTADADSSDRSTAVILNLADTAVNLAKFGARMGSVLATEEAKRKPGSYRHVRYKRLDLDVTFDPSHPEEVRNVQRLFQTVRQADGKFGETVYVTPFHLEIRAVNNPVPNKIPGTLRDKPKPKAHGLWFPELTPVEFVFRQNPEEFVDELSAAIKGVRESAGLFTTDVETAENEQKTAEGTAKRAAERVKSLQEQLKTAADKPAIETALKEAETAKKASDDALAGAERNLEKAENANKPVLDYVNAVEKALHARVAVSRTTNIIKTIPNPGRVFSFNIARSAFVQNKVTKLTISEGLLTNVSLKKQSEAEGFTLIPLELSKRLAELPKDLLTIRTEQTQLRSGLKSEKTNLVNAEDALAEAKANSADARKSAQLTAETERINAEIARQEAELKLLDLLEKRAQMRQP